MRTALSLVLFAFLFRSPAQITMGLTQYSNPNQAGYLLFAPIASTQTYLTDKCGRKINQWNSAYKAGISVGLLPDGRLLRTGLKPSADFGNTGGKGGILQTLDWNGSVLWEYVISDSTQCQHHDVKMLPNGNILVIVWDVRDSMDAVANGKSPAAMSAIDGHKIWSEKIVELKPVGTDSAVIVWQWNVFDHLVQELDNTKSNFDSVAKHPELININYNYPQLALSPDWLHLNSMDYNQATDQIMLTSHNFEEIWVIDHSTTTAQAATHTGGNSNKGGDLLYRWGNPQAYNRGTASDKKLFMPHHGHWIPPGFAFAGKVLIYNNGVNRPGGNASTIDIIQTPVDNNNLYPIAPAQPYLPDSLLWTYQDSVPKSTYANILGGAYSLANGSFMITVGTKGMAFEIDSLKRKVWQYVNPVTAAGPQTQGAMIGGNTVFRYEFYPPSYSGFNGHSLTPGSEIELSPTSPSLCVNALGIDEIDARGMELYPNPATDYATLELDVKQADDFSMVIQNLQGQQMGQEITLGWLQSGIQTKTIRLPDLSSGIYLVGCKTKEGTLFKKLAINR